MKLKEPLKNFHERIRRRKKKTSQEFIVSCDDDMFERSSHTPSVGRCLKGILQHRKEHTEKKWTSASARWERAAENWRKNFAKVSYIVGAMAGPRREKRRNGRIKISNHENRNLARERTKTRGELTGKIMRRKNTANTTYISESKGGEGEKSRGRFLCFIFFPLLLRSFLRPDRGFCGLFTPPIKSPRLERYHSVSHNGPFEYSTASSDRAGPKYVTIRD